jgi:restriction system protein
VGIPTYDLFIEPLLRYLAEQTKPVSTRDVYSELAARLQLTNADREQLLPSQSQPIYKNRIGWAHDRLKRAGLSHSPRRAMWQLTDKGRRFHGEHPQALTEAELDVIAECDRTSTVAGIEREIQPTKLLDLQQAARQSPEEQIANALMLVRERTSADLLERILGATPEFFERLVLKLLLALGYGASNDDLQHVGKSGDGGIDGVISLDRLGFEKVYVQAKRWRNSVGRPEVQGFYGALAGRDATKGVLITTSTFTNDAHQYAESVHNRVVLVDCMRLTQLMMDHGVGVTYEALKIPRIDSDEFDDV